MLGSADFDKLEGYKIERAKVGRSDQARSTHGLANEARALYNTNPSRVSWVTFLGTDT